jgi:hypothetical protein
LYVSPIQSSEGISQRNNWHSHGWAGSRQPMCGIDTQAHARGGGVSEARGGGPTGGGRFGQSAGGGGGSPQKWVSDGVGGPRTGGLGGRGWKRWRHSKIAAMMNPYLELSNGILLLSSILTVGNIRMEDLPGLNKYTDPTTGRKTLCWEEVLGPCHFPDCYFGQKRGTPRSCRLLQQVCVAGGSDSGAGGCSPDGGNACLKR